MLTSLDGAIEYGCCPLCGSSGWMFWCNECDDGERLADGLWLDVP